jgi:hypothetical protein
MYNTIAYTEYYCMCNSFFFTRKNVFKGKGRLKTCHWVPIGAIGPAGASVTFINVKDNPPTWNADCLDEAANLCPG